MISTYTISGDPTVYNAGDTVDGVLGNAGKQLIVNSNGSWNYQSVNADLLTDGVVITITFEGGFVYDIRLLTEAETGSVDVIDVSGAIPLPKVRIPGVFLKVGDGYKRAYSTTDKAYSQKTEDGAGYLNPNINGPSPDLSLSAASKLPGETNFYTYNTTISKFAQRISTNGINGSFYFHKVSPPVVTPTTDIKGVTYYNIPLFRFVA
jgi:hypothetical protein